MCLTLKSCHVFSKIGLVYKFKFQPLDFCKFLALSSCTLQYLAHLFLSLSLSPKMVTQLSGDSSLCVPLILNEKQNGVPHKLEEVESNCHYSSTTNIVSFFQTCFNGLNALSGSTS